MISLTTDSEHRNGLDFYKFDFYQIVEKIRKKEKPNYQLNIDGERYLFTLEKLKLSDEDDLDEEYLLGQTIHDINWGVCDDDLLFKISDLLIKKRNNDLDELS